MKEEILKFNIKGKTAFFKKPDVNKEFYPTYNNIHKINILGILGAILGLKGHKGKGVQPEFYTILKYLHISIVPKNNHGYNYKKIQTYNNSTAFASKELGGNLVVKEQWLENPEWDIYLKQNLIDTEIWNQIKNFLLNKKCIFIPYLGSNSHEAIISDVKLLEGNKINTTKKIDSIFIASKNNDVEKKLTGEYFARKLTHYNYLFTEFSPVALEEKYNFYIFERLLFTDGHVDNLKINNIYELDSENSNISFY